MINKDVNETTSSNSNIGLLGEFLKQKRLDKNYSLEKLSQKTKISVNILKSLEANDYGNLPSAAYIKGFITSYVKVLGVPLDEAINKMEYTYLNVLGKPFPALNHTKLMNSPKSALREGDQDAHEVIESGDSIIENTKSMLPVVIFVAVILLFVGGYKLISTVIENEVNGDKPKDLGPKIESSSALVNPKVAPQPKEVPTVATTPETTAPAASSAAVTTQPAVEEPKVEETARPAFERNFPTIDFKKVKGKLFTVKREAEENSNTDLLPDRIKSAMDSDLQNVYVRAVDGNTWLSYKIDEKPIESAIVNKGEDLFLQGGEIRIFLGNVNVTKIYYNNYLIETPTKTGVKTLVFPEESNEKFLMPLFPKAKDDVLYTAEDYMKRMKLEEEELAKRKEQ